MVIFNTMRTKRKNSCLNRQSGKADAGLLFVAGLFFLTLALAITYVSRFGLAPLPKQVEKMPASVAGAFTEADPISAPEDTAPLYEQHSEFYASLAETPVHEIFIGSYGSIDKDILEKLRAKIELAFGIKTTLLNPGAPVPKEDPFYDKNTGKYNSDVLIKSVEQSSAAYGQNTRFLYVVDFSMASPQSQGAEWLRAHKGENAALISIYPFRSNGITPRQTLLERIEKAAIRAIGTTVGFDASSSVTDSSCVMYPAATLQELDEQESEWCSPEKEAVAQVFQK